MRIRLVSIIVSGAALLAVPAEAQQCATNPCQPGCSDLCFFSSHETDPSKGVPQHWLTQPIKYKINAERVTAAVGKAAAITAIQNAFKTWESIPCTDLKFQYAGESSSTTEEPDHILVYFGNDASSWTHGCTSYFTNAIYASVDKGDITKAMIGLNATPKSALTPPCDQYSFDWTVTGPEQNKFDVQTAVTLLIPWAIGFFVGQDPKTGLVPAVTYNSKHHSLCPAHKEGAQFVYFDPNAGSGCKKPSLLECSQGTTSPDAGPNTGDGGLPPKQDSGGQPTGDGQAPVGDGGQIPSGDGVQPPPGGDDDGCCRVSHAGGGGNRIPLLSLLGLALLLLLARRR